MSFLLFKHKCHNAQKPKVNLLFLQREDTHNNLTTYHSTAELSILTVQYVFI